MADTPQRTIEERQAWYFAKTEPIPTGPRSRTRPMEVLNMGMMRTGTMSMQEALDILGVPCYSCPKMMTRPGDFPGWIEALDAKFFDKGQKYTREQWDQLIGDFGALGDVPAIAFADDLVEAYPEAKVILIDRERQAWFESFNEGVVQACFKPSTIALARVDNGWMGPMREISSRWQRGWFRCTNREEMRANAIPKYEEHYALVRKVTPPERLLEYKMGSGWEPLCAFLGKPIPDAPFPQSNNRKSLAELVGLMTRRGFMRVGWKFGAVVVPVALAAVFYVLFPRQGNVWAGTIFDGWKRRFGML